MDEGEGRGGVIARQSSSLPGFLGAEAAAGDPADGGPGAPELDDEAVVGLENV